MSHVIQYEKLVRAARAVMTGSGRFHDVQTTSLLVTVEARVLECELLLSVGIEPKAEAVRLADCLRRLATLH